MADPVTAGLIVSAVVAAAATATTAVEASQAASAQSKAAQYNADVLKQQGTQAVNTAAGNEAIQRRQSAGQLGEQAAAFGQANVGTGGTTALVEKQSRTNAELDAMDIWYGGVLEKDQADSAANLQRYQSLADKRASDMALIGGGVKSGTALLMGGAKYGVYQKYGLSGLQNFNAGFGP